MRILVIGSGAREHAIVHSLAAESSGGGAESCGGRPAHELHAAPGNPGMAPAATLHPVAASDPDAVAALAGRLGADLVVIGPEAPLVAGVADAVRAAGIACFGPSAQAARLEGSKSFAKEVMAAADVPTAESRTCTTLAEVGAALDAFGAPHVVKDDGLAAGKGVVVTSDRQAALGHARACLEGGASVVVEDYLDGPEVSLFCISDGHTVVPLQPAQDFKRALDGDEGPNTGGMGAYSPLAWAPAGLVDEVVTTIARPTIDEMARRGIPFAGVLYVGLALTSRGVRVVEFNARFGDPETQVVLARLASPLSALLYAAATGQLADLPQLRWSDDAAVTVVVASEGYPGTPVTGRAVRGIERADRLEDVYVLHAGTRFAVQGPRSCGGVGPAGPGSGAANGEARSVDAANGEVLSAGGRVLSVVGTGADVAQARRRAYAGVDCIELEGSQHRTDIAAGR